MKDAVNGSIQWSAPLSWVVWSKFEGQASQRWLEYVL